MTRILPLALVVIAFLALSACRIDTPWGPYECHYEVQDNGGIPWLTPVCAPLR